MRRRVLTAVAVCAVIGACSSGDGDGSSDAATGPAAERYDLAADLVDTLDAGDVTCRAFEEDDPSPGTFGAPEGTSAGTCELSGTLEIDLYATNADARDAVTGTLDLLACNDNGPDYDILSGANWTVLGPPTTSMLCGRSSEAGSRPSATDAMLEIRPSHRVDASPADAGRNGGPRGLSAPALSSLGREPKRVRSERST